MPAATSSAVVNAAVDACRTVAAGWQHLGLSWPSVAGVRQLLLLQVPNQQVEPVVVLMRQALHNSSSSSSTATSTLLCRLACTCSCFMLGASPACITLSSRANARGLLELQPLLLDPCLLPLQLPGAGTAILLLLLFTCR
jgi:hypothetical protein